MLSSDSALARLKVDRHLRSVESLRKAFTIIERRYARNKKQMVGKNNIFCCSKLKCEKIQIDKSSI